MHVHAYAPLLYFFCTLRPLRPPTYAFLQPRNTKTVHGKRTCYSVAVRTAACAAKQDGQAKILVIGTTEEHTLINGTQREALPLRFKDHQKGRAGWVGCRAAAHACHRAAAAQRVIAPVAGPAAMACTHGEHSSSIAALRRKRTIAAGQPPLLAAHPAACRRLLPHEQAGPRLACMKPLRIWLETSPSVPGLWFMNTARQIRG